MRAKKILLVCISTLITLMILLFSWLYLYEIKPGTDADKELTVALTTANHKQIKRLALDDATYKFLRREKHVKVTNCVTQDEETAPDGRNSSSIQYATCTIAKRNFDVWIKTEYMFLPIYKVYKVKLD